MICQQARKEFGLFLYSEAIVLDRYKNNERFTVISGYAGTGKSTLVKYLIAALNVREDDVCYAAFTGKAAQVLLKKGNKNVSTLHRLLFKSFPKPDGTFYRRKVSSIPYKIVIVDEVSMAPKSLMQILFSFKNELLEIKEKYGDEIAFKFKKETKGEGDCVF